MNKKQLLLALLAGAASVSSVQTMDDLVRDPEPNELEKDGGAASRAASAAARRFYLAVNAALGTEDVKDFKDVGGQVITTAGHQFAEAKEAGRGLAAQGDKMARDGVEHVRDAARGVRDYFWKPTEQYDGRTARHDLENLYITTPKNVVEATKGHAHSLYQGGRERAVGLQKAAYDKAQTIQPGLKAVGKDVQDWWHSWAAQDESAPSSPMAAGQADIDLKANSNPQPSDNRNFTHSPLPIAGAFVSTIALDRVLALLGKAFPKLLSTGDEHRKNGTLLLSLLGTGIYGSRRHSDEGRENKVFGLSVLFAAATLAVNSMRRWLREAQPGEKMPTYLQELKHAIKIGLLHYFNMHMAAKLRESLPGNPSNASSNDTASSAGDAVPPSQQDS